MRKLAVALAIGMSGWTGSAGAQLFSSTGPVIAILGGKLLVGEATGHLGGWGTLTLHSRSSAGPTCVGEFSRTDAHGDAGELRCSDGARAAFHFQRLSLTRGYGAGNSELSALTFTYGLSAEESEPYLRIPPGKILRREGDELELAAAAPLPAPSSR
jgi:hypothetical protein